MSMYLLDLKLGRQAGPKNFYFVSALQNVEGLLRAAAAAGQSYASTEIVINSDGSPHPFAALSQHYYDATLSLIITYPMTPCDRLYILKPYSPVLHFALDME